jgi:hypothetical protein
MTSPRETWSKTVEWAGFMVRLMGMKFKMTKGKLRDAAPDRKTGVGGKRDLADRCQHEND